MGILPKDEVKRRGDIWASRLIRAAKFRKKYGFQDRWDDLDRYYRNEFDPSLKGLPNFNLIYMHGRSLLPTLVYRRPSIINTPSRPEFIPYAMLLDALDALLVKEMEVEDVLKEAALFAYLFNMAGIQVGYDFPSSTNTEPNAILSSYYGFNSPPGQEGKRARRTNFPFLDLIEPRKLLFPWGTKTIRDLPWFAKHCTLPISVLVDTYGVPRNKIREVGIPAELDALGLDEDLKKQYEYDQYASFFEVHDLEKGTWFFLESTGNMLMEPVKDPLQIDGSPLETVVFNPNTQSIWGTPDSLYIESQMLEGIEIRVQGRKQRRVALLKFLIDENMLSREEAEKLFKEDIPLIRIKNTKDKPLTESVVALQPHVQGEYFTYQKQLLEDSQLLLGFGPNQLGTYAPGRRTKFEAQVVEERNAIRISERRELLGNVIAKLFRKVNQLVTTHWNTPVVERIVGIDAALYWVKIDPKSFRDIKLEVETNVDVESMAPASKARTNEELLQFMQILGRIPNVNIYPLLQTFLGRSPYLDIKKILPQAVQGEALNQTQFAQQQQGLMQQPPQQLAETIKKNLGPLTRK